MTQQQIKLITDAKKVYVQSKTADFSLEGTSPKRLVIRNKFSGKLHPFQKDGDPIYSILIGKSDLVHVSELIRS